MPLGSTKEYEYRLDNEFFANIDGPEVQRGKIDVVVTVNRTATLFEIDFDLAGVIYIPCDRCLDDMELPIDVVEKLYVKLGHEYIEESDNMITIPEDEGGINIAWFLYEYIALAIPIKHTHPYGKCNKEISEKLQQLSAHRITDDDAALDEMPPLIDESDENPDERPTDPRWDALKKLKR